MNRITELRIKKNKSMMQVAKDLQIPYTTFVNYEKGEREPNSEMLIQIANYFSVSVDYLIGRSENIELRRFRSPIVTNDTVTFPVLGEIAAGFDYIAIEDWSGETVEVPVSFLKGRKSSEFFVLTVKGDSMYPDFKNGDKVLILRQNTVERSGDVGAVIYDNECATLKKIEFAKGEDWLKLVPINPQFKPETIEGVELESCRILGVPFVLIRECFED